MARRPVIKQEPRHGCDKCEFVFTAHSIVRWVARWDGKTFVKSYRCKEHLPRV